MAKKMYLIDLDGVLADLERGFLDEWRHRYPQEAYIPLDQRNVHYIDEQYPSHATSKINEIIREEGFFAGLPVIPGGLQALEEMAGMGHDVFICTSPMSANPYCSSEKMSWVEQHLGSEWKKKVVIAKDKTLVRGDILIDDRPVVAGVHDPSWVHVHYAQPYNVHPGNIRVTWDTWRRILEPTPEELSDLRVLEDVLPRARPLTEVEQAVGQAQERLREVNLRAYRGEKVL